jgi:XRE family transcriptional regulator, aerobic/anaerobic benzoate catabolism transcriptional regulator
MSQDVFDTGTTMAATAEVDSTREPLLAALGERVRTLRARRGLTRKAAARAAEVSERHFANLEYGTGNASILILQQVAQALNSSLAELLGDVTTGSPEWLLIRELLAGRTEEELQRARMAIGQSLGQAAPKVRSQCVALIGLRGAGKSTLGALLADDLEVPFLELSREIEKVAGCTIREIHDLYGSAAYRRYERRALEETLQNHPQAVIATPGGLVSDVASLNLLLNRCLCVWIQATPEEHLSRVTQQGDLRPMAASAEAMEDLRRILAGRSAFYSKADLTVDTSRQLLADSFQQIRTLVRAALQLSA